MENTTYALRPLLAEIRDGFRGLRAIRISRRAATRESTRAARATTAHATTAHATTGSTEEPPSRSGRPRWPGIYGSGR
jgi:hypothetical protein